MLSIPLSWSYLQSLPTLEESHTYFSICLYMQETPGEQAGRCKLSVSS